MNNNMSDTNNEIDVVDVDNNNITTEQPLRQLPRLKKWSNIEYEQLRLLMLEVVTGTGVPYQYFEVQNMPTCPWVKLYNGLYDLSTGVFKGYQ